jgi:hypothetical protein
MSPKLIKALFPNGVPKPNEPPVGYGKVTAPR